MLHVLRMPLALFTAQPTRPGAGLKRRPRHLRIERRLSREDLASGVADVGAVEVEPNTAGQHLYVPLAEAGVRAGGTGLFTVEAGLDALHQRVGVNSGTARIRLQHPSGIAAQDLSPFRSYCAGMPLPQLIADIPFE